VPLPPLTPQQQTAYVYIETVVNRDGRPPTLDEIRESLGAASINTAQRVVRALVEKGYIERDPGKARGILLTHPNSPPVTGLTEVREVPIRRSGSTDDSTLTQLLAEKLRVDTRFLRGLSSSGACFAIRNADHGMSPDGILQGDLVVVVKVTADRVEPGDLVVCARRGEFLVRRFEQVGALPSLVASDTSYATIHPTTAQSTIEGRVIAIMRRL